MVGIWNKIKKFASNVWEGAKKIVPKIWEGVKKVAKVITPFIPPINGIPIGSLISGGIDVIDNIADRVSGKNTEKYDLSGAVDKLKNLKIPVKAGTSDINPLAASIRV